MNNKTKILAQGKRFSKAIELLILNGRGAGELVFKEMDEAAICEPTITIDHDAAQELMDELWHCGIRPSEGSGSAGSLMATEKHLSDMRKIAFNKLKINL